VRRVMKDGRQVVGAIMTPARYPIASEFYQPLRDLEHASARRGFCRVTVRWRTHMADNSGRQPIPFSR
jgi:hypothetical protein